jgi:dihydrolipoamide dehydrogenase
MYKIIIVGAGPGGYVAAIKAAQMGLKVALIEKHKIGGVCLNYGCIPTKTLLRSAKLYKDMMHASSFGIDIANPSSIQINWPNMMERKNKVVTQLVGGIEQLLRHNKVDVIQGEAKILDQHTLVVDGKQFECENLILATGSSVTMPNIPGLDEAFKNGDAINSSGAIALKEQPKKLTVLGGGVIAVEFATLYSSLGTEVTLIQRSDSILKNLDKDVKRVMTRHLKKLGVKVITNTSIDSIEGKTVHYTRKNKQEQITSDRILVSLGRRANLKGLEVLNLKTDRGFVITDEHMETSTKGVYAIGDLNGKYMLAHVASAEGILAVEAIMDDKKTIDYKKIPSCIYSFPEVGVVGYTEDEAIDAGFKVKTSLFPLSANGKALAEGESDGFVKLVYDDTYGEVLGVHIVASHATDMIAEAVASMELEATVHDLAKTVHPHPTLSEIVMEAAHGALDQPIHIIKR